MITPSSLLLSAVVLIAFAVESSLGFGASLVTVTLGALIVPLDELLPAFIPLNMLLSAYLALRYRRDIDTRYLFRVVLPPVVLGLPIGMFALEALDPRVIKIVLGAFIALLASMELVRITRKLTPKAPSLWSRVGFLALGGVAHGAFTTGGPMVVYVTSFDLADKSKFRATLSTLWLMLNTILFTQYVVSSRITTKTLTLDAWLAVSLALGIVAGEALHRRVPAPIFRRAVYVMLLLAGGTLLVRNLLGT